MITTGAGNLKNCPNVQIGNDWLEYHLQRLAMSYDLTAPEPTPATATPVLAMHTPVLCW